MATTIRQPTSNESPDSSQIVGDVIVVSPTDTGHAETTAEASGAGSEVVATCRWFDFSGFPGGARSITLKFTHTSDGTLTGPTAGNLFSVDYSTNGGSSWSTAVSRSNFATSEGPTVASVALSTGQDITQVQVRDIIDALSDDAGDSAQCIVTISDIQIEIVTTDQAVIMF